MKNLFFLSLIIFFSSCVKQVSLDDQHEKKLVVEGFIELGQPTQLLLSETISVTDSIDYPKINTATILLDNGAENEALQNIGEGLYITEEIIGKENERYSLKIEFDGEIYETITKMPDNLLVIDTVFYDLVEGESTLTLYLEGSKLEDVDVYGGIKLYKNDVLFRSGNFFLSENLPLNETINQSFTDENWKIGDVLKIELLQMEKWLNDYFFALENNDVSNSVNGLLVSPPGEIYNNFDGDILGFFGAIRKQTIEVIIE